MKVRKAIKGREYTINEEDGEQIKCPICKAVWNNGEEMVGKCKHLRFFYFDVDFVSFYGKWNKAKFKKIYNNAKDEIINKDGYCCILDVFKKIQFEDLNAIYVEFDYDPSLQPLGIWGYSK